MSLPSSQDDDFMDLLHHRDLTAISNDQQRLLDRDDTWAVSLEKNAREQAHVPGHVLETLKAAHLHINQEPQEDTKPSSSSSNNGAYESAEDTYDVTLPEPDDHSSRSKSRESSPGQPICPWSQSPDRNHQNEQDGQSPQSPIRQTQASDDIQTPLSQPRYTATIGENYSAASSSEPEEMAVEVPQGHVPNITVANNINGHARGAISVMASGENRSTSTPTCAQPDERIIPGTVVQAPRSPKTPVPHQAKRRRRMKLIQLGSSLQRANPPSVVRMEATKTFVEAESSNEVSSSYVPVTFDGPDGPKAEVTNRESTPAIQTQPDIALVAPKSGLQSDSESVESAGSQSLFVEQEASLDGSAVAQKAQPDLDTDPFGSFNAKYPDYTTHNRGNIDHFIKACVCLDFIRKKDLVRDQLYDDFIRSWSADYWIYVNNAKPGQEPLPAARWYNRQRGEILYSGGLINQGNVEHVLETYREQVAKMQPLIQASDTEEEEVESIEPEEVQPNFLEEHDEIEADISPAETAAEERMETDEPESERKPSSPRRYQSDIASQSRHSPSPRPNSRTPTRRVPAPPSSIHTTKQRSSGGNTYLQRLASRSSSATNQKRSEAELKRFREHIRKRNSSAASVGSSGTPRR